jgi:hypothetical protein
MINVPHRQEAGPVMHMLRASLLLLFAATTGCAGNTTTSTGNTQSAGYGETDTNAGRLEVSNRTNFDMDIYAVGRGAPVRVGFAPASETTTFKLNPGLIAGAGAVRFEARPNQGGSQNVLSEPYNLVAGQTITWDIPPQ